MIHLWHHFPSLRFTSKKKRALTQVKIKNKNHKIQTQERSVLLPRSPSPGDSVITASMFPSENWFITIFILSTWNQRFLMKNFVSFKALKSALILLVANPGLLNKGLLFSLQAARVSPVSIRSLGLFFFWKKKLLKMLSLWNIDKPSMTQLFPQRALRSSPVTSRFLLVIGCSCSFLSRSQCQGNRRCH